MRIIATPQLLVVKRISCPNPFPSLHISSIPIQILMYCCLANIVIPYVSDLDFPSIPHVIAKVDNTTVAVEKIPKMLFMEWLIAPTEPMWTQDSTGTQCLELNGRYSDIFRCIVATLTYLHSRGKCHGNLKNDIFVTGQEEDHRIGFTNFNIGFEIGLKSDLQS
ncbi:hypothetical protein RHGRI_030520 [Rhododendron griersonianum]|uniref:Protein kinase domain-containing protein n=1 Tax=Rhododendron griersonianum TaxID=479676 RepID=A0AAV6IRH4_9ERIC|nr:hypothetical protein RHGRI_030520 [Rhododendron griersonianum]